MGAPEAEYTRVSFRVVTTVLPFYIACACVCDEWVKPCSDDQCKNCDGASETWDGYCDTYSQSYNSISNQECIDFCNLSPQCGISSCNPHP